MKPTDKPTKSSDAHAQQRAREPKASHDESPAHDDSKVVRFGVAMPASLLERFDRHVQRRGYDNRSEALRDLVRSELASDAWDRGEHMVAAITMVYDHHVLGLTEKLVSIQHDSQGHVISTMHVHLDHSRCLETLVVQGPARELERMSDTIRRTRGVLVQKIVPAVAVSDLTSWSHDHDSTESHSHDHLHAEHSAEHSHTYEPK